jgi:hypothetical protein
MSQNDKTQNVELPLNEEEHEEAPPGLQIRNLILVNEVPEALDRDDVELKFKMKVGKPPEGRNLADNRTYIELYDRTCRYYRYKASVRHIRGRL